MELRPQGNHDLMTPAAQGKSEQGGPDGRAETLASVIPTARGKGGSMGSSLSGMANVVLRIAEQVSASRVWLSALGHLLLFVVVYWIAFGLRFDFDIPCNTMDVFWMSLPWLIAIKFVVFFLWGHYDGWWGYVAFVDLVALIRAASLSLIIIVIVDHFVFTYQVPRSVLLIDYIFAVVALGAVRASWRQFREQFRPGFNPKNFRWALLVGTDFSSRVLAHQIQSDFHLPYRVRGFLAIDDETKRSRLGQIPILGPVENVREIAAATRAKEVLVTAGTLSGTRLRKLMEVCEEAGLNLKIIRSAEDRLHGDHRIPLRDIEINDLLQRDPVVLDTENIGKLVEGRAVMVTGAGGSIGSEICRQVLKFKPRVLVLVGNGENPIFRIEKELRGVVPSIQLHLCIADVTDKKRVRQLFEEYRLEVIFHAAAHKHVPMMEVNVGQAVKNNVCGTKILADMAGEFRARNFVFISTDKAVHPTSVMGVTKHIAERYVCALSQESSTQFTVVRFGNVLGSDGSVVPIFQEQIRAGGPVTVTDPRMTRFFMTIPEASQLVLQAASMGSGGEIFVLEMGEPIKIVDLARDLIRLSGLPEHAIEISFVGIRRGEKLYEELYFDDEETLPTRHPKLRAAYHRAYCSAEVHAEIEQLAQLIYGPEEAIRKKLHAIVPEYVVSNGTAVEPEGRLAPQDGPSAPEMNSVNLPSH